MARRWRSVGLAVLSAALLGSAACSTGTVDRELFAHTQEETFSRVRSAVPVGTPVDAAQATLKAMGWSCYVANHGSLTPNDTRTRLHSVTLSCEAYPSLGGYPLSKQYSLEFLVEGGAVGPLQVIIGDPAI